MAAEAFALADVKIMPGLDDILDSLDDAVLMAGPDGVICYGNKAALAYFGGELNGLDLGDLFPDLAGSHLPLRSRTLQAADRSSRLCEVAVRLAGAGFFTFSIRQIGQKEATAAADRDELTGLLYRAGFTAVLDTALGKLAPGSALAVHCIDLDRFKMVNDTLGHGVGDQLLAKVADRIRSACRKEDAIARVGGDEFVVLQTNIGAAEEAEKLAARLVDLLSRTYVIQGNTVNIAASIGVAIHTDPVSARDAIRDADLALYEAKRAGRNRFQLFEQTMALSMQQRRELDIELRRALALKQFELYYQPFLDLETESVIGFEALMRWRHPTRGMVSPAEFIPLAEETGLIVKLGEWVLRTACHAAAGWKEPLSVAVNVSPLQFKSDSLLQTVKLALEKSGLPPERLELEITEGALLDDTANVLTTLYALRKLGVKISMDDFGTGYSSLSYLQKFPFDKIKLDRSFVADASRDSEAILKAVAALGNSLGMAITAEGVETAEQLARIRRERCTLVQGFLTGRPMAIEAVTTFLSQQERF